MTPRYKTDPRQLRSVQPHFLEHYLSSRGWQRLDADQSLSEWVTPGGDLRVVIAQRTSYADYAERVHDVLVGVAEHERRAWSDVLVEVQHGNFDFVRLRTELPVEGDLDSVPLESAERLISGLRMMLLAAACSELNKQPAFFARKPAHALDFISSARLAHTRRGSFVFTVYSPLEVNENTGQGWLLCDGAYPVQPPYQRRVLHNLFRALARAETLETSEQDDQAIKDAVAEGVTSNLLDAMVEMREANPGESLELSVDWSPLYPAASGVERAHRFSRTPVDRLRHASELLKGTAPRPEFVLEGVVVGLNRPDGEGVGGEVKVRGVVDGQLRTVQLALGEAEYQEACNAHRDGTAVAVTGDLVRRGKNYRLADAGGLHVVPDDDDDGE